METPRDCAHEELGRYNSSEELWELMWFGPLRTYSTNVGQKVVNFYFHSICSETKCSFAETEASEEGYRLKKLTKNTERGFEIVPFEHFK